MKPWPIRIATYNDITACGTIWRHRGRFSLTIIVKATFSLVPDGPLALASPVPIASDDEAFGGLPTRSVATACETWPYLGKCDVTFIGNAYSSLRPTNAARLALFRNGSALIDKTIHVFGDRDTTGNPKPFSKLPIVYERALGGPGYAANPVGTDKPNLMDPRNADKPACFAPISRHWPVRKRQLPDALRQSFGAAVLDLPEQTPWAFFQAAPPDQQVDFLTGDEWIVLDGLHESAPRVATHLAGAKSEARVVRRGATEATPVPLVCDTLSIDGDALRASLVWRGVFELQQGTPALDELTVLAALTMPGRTIDWSKLEELAAKSAESDPKPPPAIARQESAATNPGEETSMLAEDTGKRAAERAAMPFAARSPGPKAAGPSMDATPFSGSSSKAAPAPSAEGTIAVSNRGDETIATSPAREAPRLVTPFPIEPPKPDEKPPVSATPWASERLAQAPAVVPGDQTLTAAPKVGQNQRLSPSYDEKEALPQLAPALISVLKASPERTFAPVAPVAPVAPPVAKPKPEPPPRRVPLPWTTTGMADGLRHAGVDVHDIAALLDALSPPAPPPDEV